MSEDQANKKADTSREVELLESSSLSERVFHQLARVFNGLHWVLGITTLPANSTAKEERSFVLMWLGLIVFIVVFFALFIYWLTL